MHVRVHNNGKHGSRRHRSAPAKPRVPDTVQQLRAKDLLANRDGIVRRGQRAAPSRCPICAPSASRTSPIRTTLPHACSRAAHTRGEACEDRAAHRVLKANLTQPIQIDVLGIDHRRLEVEVAHHGAVGKLAEGEYAAATFQCAGVVPAGVKGVPWLARPPRAEGLPVCGIPVCGKPVGAGCRGAECRCAECCLER